MGTVKKGYVLCAFQISELENRELMAKVSKYRILEPDISKAEVIRRELLKADKLEMELDRIKRAIQ